MDDLSSQECELCRVGAPMVTDDEVVELMPQVPGWAIVESDGVKMIERVFKFKNFVEALAFTNNVGELAESENHHPAIVTEWGSVKVTWWTHKIKGLHKSDFVMAAKAGKIYDA